MKKHTLILLTIAVASGLPLHANDSTNRDHILAEARAGRGAAVESSLEALAANAPPDADALSELGSLRMEQRRAKDAVELLQKAAELAPNRAEVHSRLGSALSARMPELSFMHSAMTAGRMLEAFKRSVELDSDHIPGRIGLMRYYAQAPAIAGGSFTKAEEQGREVAKRNPYLGEVEFGVLRETQGKQEEALGHFQKALELRPDSVPAMIRLARVLARLGRNEEATIVYQRAIAADPANEAAAKGLAELGQQG